MGARLFCGNKISKILDIIRIIINKSIPCREETKHEIEKASKTITNLDKHVSGAPIFRFPINFSCRGKA